MSKVIITLASLLFTVNAFCGQGGSGGSGVLCLDAKNNIKKVTVLDLYEGKNLLGVKPEMGSPNAPYENKIQMVIDRVRLRDPDLAKTIVDGWTAFMSDNHELPMAGLKPVEDQDTLLRPDSCPAPLHAYQDPKLGYVPIQIAFHQTDPLPLEKHYLIDKKLVDPKVMDNDNHAALVLHEILYAKAFANGATDSRKIRNLIALITSSAFSKLSNAEYLQAMEGAAITNAVTLRGYQLAISNFNHWEYFRLPVVNDDGSLSGTPIGGAHTVMVGQTPIQLGDCDSEKYFNGCGSLELYPNGSLKSVSTASKDHNAYILTSKNGSSIVLGGWDSFSLYPDGSITGGRLAEPVNFQNDGQTFQITTAAYVHFREDGSLKGYVYGYEEYSKQPMLKLKTNGTPEYVAVGGKGACGYPLTGASFDTNGLVDLSAYEPNDLQQIQQHYSNCSP